MKVVFVHPSYPNQFTRLAAALAERHGWECAFLVDETFTGQVRREQPSSAYYGYREDAVPLSGNYYSQCLEEGARRGKAVVEALSHLRAAGRVDVVVGHASFGTTLFVRELLQLPVVSYVELPGYHPVFCRDEFPAGYPQALLDVTLRTLINASVIQSDLCIVPSDYARRLFPRELRGKVRVRMEGFSVTPRRNAKEALRQELGLPGAGPVVGFAGRTLEAVRGFDVFVRAARAIHAVRPETRFLVLGDEASIYGNEASYLGDATFKQHALRSGGMSEDEFIFRPFVPHDEFVRYLQAMDLIIFPLFEGAANWGLFEAMAAGVPLVAARRCFVPEVIEDGREGVLVEAADAAGFAAATLRLLADEVAAAQLALQAQRKIATCYSVERAADGYAMIIREALRRYRATGHHVTAPATGKTAHPWAIG